MNILVISQYYFPEPFRINEICELLVERGHNVTVVTSLPNYPEGEIYIGYLNVELREKINGVEVIRCKIRPRYQGNINLALNYISFIIAARKVVRKLSDAFDIVYGYQLSPVTSMFPAIYYKKKHKVPFFLYCLDAWPASVESVFGMGSIMYKLIEVISKTIYRKADSIGVTSPCFIQYLSYIENSNKKMCYIPQHAEDMGGFISKDLNYERISSWENVINFMFIGNVGESQNVEGILKALSRVENKSKIHLHIVGSGSAIKGVKVLCEKLLLKDKVTFYGRQPKEKLLIYYDMADVCIVSLRKEGVVGHTIPGKLQEYMSAGKPIIASIDGDATYVINDAKCGICVPAEDEQALADAMDRLIHNNKMLKKFGENARAYYCKHFTLSKFVDRTEKKLKALLPYKGLE